MSGSVPQVLLVGCPNVGKSVLFWALTGRYATVSNYPGTTVEILRGRARISGNIVDVIDTPGLYGWPPTTPDERAAAQALTTPVPRRIIVQVVTVAGLGRMLALTHWLKLRGESLVLVVNMLDEAERAGVAVDLDLLSRELAIPVVGCAAITGRGLDQLRRVLGSLVAAQPAAGPAPDSGYSAGVAMARGRDLAGRAVSRGRVREEGVDRWLLHPVWGPVVAVSVFYVVCILIVGNLVAGTAVDRLDALWSLYVDPAVSLTVSRLPGHVRALVTGEFGLVSMGLRYSLVIILPIVTGFFLSFSLLEDAGYLPRLAVVVDRVLRPAGLSGLAAIPLSLGLGCGTMATVFTRVLPDERERVATTLLLALVVPCSAQLGVITALLAERPGALALWAGTVGLVAVVAALGTRWIPGTVSPLLLELPPVRAPRMWPVVSKVRARVGWYVREVVPVLLAVCLGLWALEELGLLGLMQRGLSQVLALACLPSEVAPALLLGFIRRDYGAAGLYRISDQLGTGELAVACILLTLSFPCVAQVAVMVRERGVSTGLAIMAAVLATALIVTVVVGRLVIGEAGW